jgi:hypothetical protein
MTTLTGVLRENPLKLPKNEGTNYSIIMRREVAPRVAERSGAECWRKGGLVRNYYAGLVIWNASSSHKRALGPLKESACGESRYERPADRAVGVETARTSVLGEASSSSSCCTVAI